MKKINEDFGISPEFVNKNYCRNPNVEKGIWCYTTAENDKNEIDYCSPIVNDEDTEADSGDQKADSPAVDLQGIDEAPPISPDTDKDEKTESDASLKDNTVKVDEPKSQEPDVVRRMGCYEIENQDGDPEFFLHEVQNENECQTFANNGFYTYFYVQQLEEKRMCFAKMDPPSSGTRRPDFECVY